MRLPVIQRADSAADSGIALADRSLPLTYLKILRAGSLWLECRPELRNHGVGWMRAVERLRNGGVPRNPVFLMPATHCSNGFSPCLSRSLSVSDSVCMQTFYDYL